ncbi:hypothetical protein N0M98_05410 [Paenibacillus doosanensis]|uniref:Uncharacterized protein n=1 Tax=Paenibacillus konkukensis TaxID=2020716 RepID=A0ABY4RRK4_9BACL|nr:MULTISPECIES: hypothetical protein [Paenibacillus]MCS7459572.1 hypothetical protein [Paenibacillus doosanensis]UQZ84768.1 hypothetical protein SK3146_04023 [Paenibacillus konkukensis]
MTMLRREEPLTSAGQEALAEQLKLTIRQCAANADLPFWGEVFAVLHQMKKVPVDRMPLYRIHPIGEVAYDASKRRFIVRIPDVDITMKDAELADAIVKQGLFHPQ